MKKMLKDSFILMGAFSLGAAAYAYAEKNVLKNNKALKDVEKLMKDITK